MTLSITRCISHISHALGSGPGGAGLSPELDAISLINECGHAFCNANDWHFLWEPPTEIDGRANVTVATATFTSATKTLTKAAAFANYTFVEGDRFDPTGGTAVHTKEVRIVSKTDANDIVLAEDITTDATDPTDVGGTVMADACAMPTNFHRMLDGDHVNSTVNSLIEDDLGRIISLRTHIVTQEAGTFHYAITSATPANISSTGTSGGQPIKRMEVYPGFSSNVPGAFVLFFARGWVNVASDDSVISVPDYCEGVFIRFLRAFAKGYEHDDEAEIGVRLEAVKLSSEWRDAVKADGGVQRNIGRLRGGAIRQGRHGMTRRFLRSEVSAPS